MKLLKIVFSAFLFASCVAETNVDSYVKVNGEIEVASRYKELELDVIKSILENYNHSTKPPAIFPTYLNESEKDYEQRMNNYIDSIHKIWDKTSFEFFVWDTLHKINYESIKSYLDPSFKIDSLNKVFDTNSFTINVTSIQSDNIKIVNDKYYSLEALDTVWKRPEFNGLFQFSKMIFNSDTTKVILHYSNHCGRFCGAGFKIKLQRKENTWEVIEKELTSVE